MPVIGHFPVEKTGDSLTRWSVIDTARGLWHVPLDRTHEQRSLTSVLSAVPAGGA